MIAYLYLSCCSMSSNNLGFEENYDFFLYEALHMCYVLYEQERKEARKLEEK